MNGRGSQRVSRQLYPLITDAKADDWRGGSGPCADIFFGANLVISRAARFKRATKILRRELVHVR
jgi:hypothetical protein